VRLHKDASVAKNHVRLELNATKRLTTVKVLDLKGGSTVVRNVLLGEGKASRAFLNDKVTIGDTVLVIRKL